MAYLIKITIAWTLFLLLFELFYKSNRKFVANRIYLLLSIGLGLLIPFIPLPASTPKSVAAPASSSTQAVYLPFAASMQQNTAPGCAPAASTPVIQAPEQGPDMLSVIGIVYFLGAFALLMKCLVELYKMLRLISKAQVQILHGQSVIVTGKTHAPYSFLGRIFIADPAAYTTQELGYIIQHEAAHHNRKHSLDLWLMQLACIVFWFHPLIWRYRYLLQMQHEYEADAVAANNDPYSYGHFLVQQTLLNGVPLIAHSFHFSPIKNRINMLTQKNSLKTGNWKYILLVPVLFACTLLMAKGTGKAECAPAQNTTTFSGNTFTWRLTDTMFYDKKRGETVMMSENQNMKWLHVRDTRRLVYDMNGEMVYENEKLDEPASYNKTGRYYDQYLQQQFAKLTRNTSDSLTLLFLSSIVVDKEGKVVYCNYRYGKRLYEGQKDIKVSTYPDPVINAIMDKIIVESPKWKPAMVNGTPVNTTVNYQVGC